MQYQNTDSEFEEKIVQVNRVSKKTQGGNKIGFSVLMVVGDRKGKVGVGLGKAADVQSSIRKASSYAKRHMTQIPMSGTTITHQIVIKLGAARLILKPASPGTGVIAGGAVRAVVEAAGIKDILSKVLGTSNKASNVYATLSALKKLRPARPTREVKVEEKVPEVVVEESAATEVKETPKKATKKATKATTKK